MLNLESINFRYDFSAFPQHLVTVVQDTLLLVREPQLVLLCIRRTGECGGRSGVARNKENVVYTNIAREHKWL